MPTPRQEPRYRRRGSGYFYAYWYDEETRQTRRESLGTKDPAEARERFAKWLSITGEITQRRELTVSDAMRYYLEHRQFRSPASEERMRRSAAHVTRHLGHLLVSDLTKAHSRTYLQRRAGVAGSTLRLELATLTAAMRFCHADELIDRVPRLELPPASPPRDRWLTAEEIDRLIAAASRARSQRGRMSRVERFIWIALETGARHQSIVNLSWARVDLAAGMIDFRDPGKALTSKRQARVPISERLRPILKRAWEERVNDLWVLDNRGTLRKSFKNAVTAAGLTGVTPHTLRHTCATQMARAGVPMFVIAQVLGDDVATVTKNYLHHDPDHLKGYLNYERT